MVLPSFTSVKGEPPMKSQRQKETEISKDLPGKSPQRSPFTTGTVELVLQLLPIDESPDGRRIRHMLSLNGKALVLGTHRSGELPALFISLGVLSPDAILARLEEYVAQCQQQVNALQHKRAKKPALPAKPDFRSRPAEAQSQASPLPSQPQAELKLRPAAHIDAAEIPQQLTLF